MSKKYKAGINTITAYMILQRTSLACKESRDEFNAFIYWCIGKFGVEFDFYAKIPLDQIEPELKYHPEWESFFLKHHFIEKVALSEKYYQKGDKFIYNGCSGSTKYVLAAVGPKDQMLLVACDGQHYFGEPPIAVRNVWKITESEFELLTRGNTKDFTKEEDPK